MRITVNFCIGYLKFNGIKESEKMIERGGIIFTHEEEIRYEMFVQEMVKIISIYGKQCLDELESMKKAEQEDNSNN